mmetsp:Transcript_26535/g.44362  ORF Transcript_26535/g.44362 Transcript_26535/m.44362 type:complete len:326 (-) Transcript_26535:596-1573(-)
MSDFVSSPLDMSALVAHHNTTAEPIVINNRLFEATTSIGLRPTQEDRFILIPKFFADEMTFCGVFDGTVGPDASDFIAYNICSHLCATTEIKEMIQMHNTGGGDVSNEVAAGKIRIAMHSAFTNADAALIQMCAEKALHYASSTGVAAFLWKNLLTVAHIGDSKACIAKWKDNELHPEWLTVDHKPHMPHELARIEASGGSLAWLHGNKPYIRGGDFFRRQANGEHPKQLNYSRAFGGKDLKMYGLSAEPDINHFEITSDDKLVLIASDGLWDVLNPKVACDIALAARREGRSATNDIVQRAIHDMPICGVRDNITVLALFLNDL